MASPKKSASGSPLRWLLLLPVPILWCVLGHYRQLTFFENKLLDWRMQYRGEIEAPVKLMYVDIDTRALELMGERPWSRALFANVAESLIVLGGAKAVGFDIVFSNISRSKMVNEQKLREGNRELRRVILENPMRVILGAQYTQGETVTQAEGTLRRIPLLRKGQLDRTKNDVPEMPEQGFVLGPKGAIGRIGLIDVDEEYGGDNVPRWVPLFVHTMNPTLYHMSLQLVLQHLGLDEKAVRIGTDRLDLLQSDGTPLITIPLREGQLLEANWFSKWNNPNLNPRRSVAEVINALAALESDDKEQKDLAEKLFAQFKDALVLIGPTDSLLQDLAPTPFDSRPVPKVSLHGNLVKTILAEKFIVHLPEWSMWTIAMVLTLIVSALSVAGGARGLLAKLVAILALGGYTLVCFYLFERSNLVLPMAAPLGAAFTTSFGAIIWQLIDEEKAKGRIKGMFGAYVSPQLVERMVDSGDDPQLGGHDAEITAYFSDIQSFSTFSEKLGSGPLVELMNEYLTACTDIVQEEGGTLDKYIGDAVVAMFGAPIALPDHAFRACVATQRVHLKLGELRAKWTAEGAKWPEVVCKMQSRIGLNSGVCMIGNMGSRTRFNYTMMGDNVNLAARMESGAKQWGAYTMCTDVTKSLCEKHGGDRVVFRPLGRIVVKGRTQAVPIFEIVGLKENVTEQTRECVGTFAQALEKYYARDWAGALQLFAQSRELEFNVPGKTPGVVSNPSLVYLDITEHYKHEPPPENWDGVYVMKEVSDPHAIRPVAVLRTPFAEKFGVPRQSGLVPEAEGRVEFLPEFSAPEFTRGLAAFSHVWLVTGFHENPPWSGSAVVRPPRLGGNERVGVFASRSPNRPNSLGLSLVRLLAIESAALRVGGVDAVDGTPVYDVKPYLPWCEAHPTATADWAHAAPFAFEAEEITISDEFSEKLGAATTALVRQILRLEVQPAYHDEPARTYGMTIAGWNVRWRAGANRAPEVCAVEPVGDKTR